jgi:hypothetical protein
MTIEIGPGIDFGPGIYIGGGSSPVLSNLTMYLNADDSASYPGTGSTWYDISGNNADIALTGSPTFTSGTPAYFTFNGTSQAGTGSTTGVLSNSSYTKSLWFYLNGYNDNNFSSSAAGGHFMYMGPGGATHKIYCGHTDWPDYTVFPSTTTFNLSTWYYVAVTFDTTVGMTLYVNGVQDATYTANKSAFTGNGSTNIATFNGVGNWLNGRISKTFFYNKRLTSTEVLQNYNSTKAEYGY